MGVKIPRHGVIASLPRKKTFPAEGKCFSSAGNFERVLRVTEP